MDSLKIYSPEDLSALISYRDGEVKLGQRVQTVSSPDEIALSNAQFVLIGIPEDIGVRANQGMAGAATAWQPALKALLNIQSTRFFDGEELLVFGYFDFTDPEHQDIPSLQRKVEEIDALVGSLIQKIVILGKTPIVIGGGHNNAYPIMKGTSLALKRSVDVINIDAHADLRPPEGRHSGNGFSYAIKDGFLNHYSIFGLHQNYNNATILNEIEKRPHIHAMFFDDMLKSQQPLSSFWSTLLKQTDQHPGLEIDLDCIENVLSSAITPSGFSINEIRRLILTSAKEFAYLHLCEGAAALIDGRQDQTTAKVMAYLVSDFIKSQK